MPSETSFGLKFIYREVTSWGGLALRKHMIDGMRLKEAQHWW